jgi:hypothetical protein
MKPLRSLPSIHPSQTPADPGIQPSKANTMKRTLQQIDPRSNPFNEPTPEPPWKRMRFPLDKADRSTAASDLNQNAPHSGRVLGRFGAQIRLPTASHEKRMKDVAHVLGIDDHRRPGLDFPAKKLFRIAPSFRGFSDLETRRGNNRLWRGTNQLGGIGKASSRGPPRRRTRSTTRA